MAASVKIMLSYDYCHFEICKSSDENMTDAQINDMRKDCQRLADEAVRQYKVAKSKASQRVQAKYDKEHFVRTCEAIEQKPEGERTINEVAMLKQLKDENWEARFDYNYDYEDDSETRNWN